MVKESDWKKCYMNLYIITEPEENVFFSLNMLLCPVLTFKKLKFMSMVDLSNVICSLVDEDGTRTLKIIRLTSSRN